MEDTLRDSLASEGHSEGWHPAGPGGKADFCISRSQPLSYLPSGLRHRVLVMPLHTRTLGRITTDTREASLGTHFYGLKSASQPKENVVRILAQINQTNLSALKADLILRL